RGRLGRHDRREPLPQGGHAGELVEHRPGGGVLGLAPVLHLLTAPVLEPPVVVGDGGPVVGVGDRPLRGRRGRGGGGREQGGGEEGSGHGCSRCGGEASTLPRGGGRRHHRG